MIRKNPRGDFPQVHESAFVDPTAILCGKVVIHENVFIGPYAVIRADEMDANGHMEPIVIGAHSNIQDGVVIHSKSGAAVTIGERTSIAHRAIMAPALWATGFLLDSTACCLTARLKQDASCATTPWWTAAICLQTFMCHPPSALAHKLIFPRFPK